ncbi:prepilin peptidase dependent protein A [Frischella perrara]|uniref:Prepilin-type N-terminal cleavage/methylation domain protein n=1 Tax=Frischella perrara TaxID=1267021 RepID=A0A0A7S3J6_FRIPE|nr:prepilin-type N-terminal cleavage/methylation domain-containing protein [Frischella perrara]AJA45377.1 prepilin-type N-terminal cleavage/methylation domain protein [Frischella perrara]PWV63027.1 prepilin peptidase dependent protein A [Frischella perrara]
MQQKGFSLFELLIVVVISSVMFTIAIVNWREFQLRSELRNTTLALVTFLNQVKSNANFQNRNNAIYIIKEEDQPWRLIVIDNEQNDHDQIFFQFINPNNQVEILNKNNDLLSIFHGRRCMAQPETIKLKNDIGESRIIISTRGRIRYCAYAMQLAGFPKC